MNNRRPIRARITGVGGYAPKQVMTNHDIEKLVHTTDSWIVERTGIRERRIAAEGETAADLGVQASRGALRSAAITEKEIDLIIVATSTPDMSFPSTACMVQNQLGADQAVAFDLSAACSGFLFALSVGELYVSSGVFKRVLIIGTEVMSRIVNWKDRNTCILFGDGAGAVVLEPTEEDDGVLSTHLHSEGRSWDLIQVIPSGTPSADSTAAYRLASPVIEMKGSETFKIAVRAMEEAAFEALDANHLKPSDVDWVIPHQANQRIIKAVSERLGVPLSKVFMNLERYGNTSAASIPMAIDEAVQTGKLRKGNLILMVAFGAGLTWASALVRW